MSDEPLKIAHIVGAITLLGNITVAARWKGMAVARGPCNRPALNK